MTPYNRISIKQVMDDILDHPMMQDLSFERAINYAVEFIKLVGMPTAFENKVITIPVKDYEGYREETVEGATQEIPAIPDDCYQILSIKKKGGEEVVLNTSTSVFGVNKSNNATPSYVVRGSSLQTSFEEGELEMSYLALPSDEEGYPTIPEIASYIRALELYIKKKWFTILFDLGKLHGSIYNNVKQEYAFAVAQAQSELIKPSLDEMEAFTNMWNSLLPRHRAHKFGFSTVGSGEIKRF
jgi:hypothetical protein